MELTERFASLQSPVSCAVFRTFHPNRDPSRAFAASIEASQPQDESRALNRNIFAFCGACITNLPRYSLLVDAAFDVVGLLIARIEYVFLFTERFCALALVVRGSAASTDDFCTFLLRFVCVNASFVFDLL